MHSNGRITAPVNTDDVSSVIGHASHDVATLCSSEKINPASKNKPIRFDKIGSLSDSERLGSPADKIEGIYYGLKIATMTPLINIHGVNYEYQRVRPNIDWSRIDDFVGYDHNAVFNPSGEVASDAIKEEGCVVNIEYSENPSGTGVDIAALIPQLTSDANFTLAKCYPCALVTLGTKNYVRALWCLKYDLSGLSSKNGFCQMYDSGWQNRWVIVLDDYPTLKANDTVKVTIFFMQHINHVSYTSGIDFRNWYEVSSSLVNAQRVFACPNAVGKTVTIRTRHPKGLRVNLVLLSNNSLTVGYAPLTDADAPIEGALYTVSVYLKPSSGSGGEINRSTSVVASDVPSFGETKQFTTGVYQGTADVVYNYTWVITEGGVAVNSGSGSATLSKA